MIYEIHLCLNEARRFFKRIPGELLCSKKRRDRELILKYNRSVETFYEPVPPLSQNCIGMKATKGPMTSFVE